MSDTPVPGIPVSDPSAGLPLDTTVSRPQPGTVLLAVDGEVDTLTAPRLEAAVDRALGMTVDGAHDTAREGGTAIVVDLSGVTFLASSGLAVLIGGARRATAAGRRLNLVAATRAVTRPLEVTGADALFDIHTDLATALAAAPASVAPPPGE